MSIDDLIGLLILGTFLVFLIIERIVPARRFPRVRGWTVIGVAYFILVMGLNGVLPGLLAPEWIAAHSLLPGEKLGVIGGVLVGYPVLSLVTALAHRAYHHFNPLWRWVHQMHHAPIRVDMPGAVQFHPFDITLNIVMSLGVTIFVLGLHPLAAAWTGYVAVFYGLFQHWNVRTPQWLGYLIQRPESHCVHHEREVHAYNYSDFPLWDILMGSFRNPKTWAGESGFGDGAHRRYGAMFLGRDVNPQLDNGGGAARAAHGAEHSTVPATPTIAKPA